MIANRGSYFNTAGRTFPDEHQRSCNNERRCPAGLNDETSYSALQVLARYYEVDLEHAHPTEEHLGKILINVTYGFRKNQGLGSPGSLFFMFCCIGLPARARFVAKTIGK